MQPSTHQEFLFARRRLAISDAALDAWNANPTAPAPEEDPLAPSITFSFLSRAVMTLSYVLQNICAPKASESAVVLKQHVDHVEAEMAACELGDYT